MCVLFVLRVLSAVPDCYAASTLLLSLILFPRAVNYKKSENKRDRVKAQ